MIVPALLTAGVLGLLYASRETSIVAPTPALTPPLPPPVTPPTTGPMMPPVTAPMTQAPRTIMLGRGSPSGVVQARVGDSLVFVGIALRSDANPGGYSLDFPEGGDLVYDRPAGTPENTYRLVRPGRFSASWSPNSIVIVEVSP